MRSSFVLCLVLALPPVLLVACSNDDAEPGPSSSAGVAGGGGEAGDNGEGAGNEDVGGAPSAGARPILGVAAGASGGVGGAADQGDVAGGPGGVGGAGDGAQTGLPPAKDPLHPDEYDELVCTARFAFAAKARSKVGPLVSQFNECTKPSDCKENVGMQLSCADGNSFWLGGYVVRADAEQSFVDAIAGVADEICDDAPRYVKMCIMGGITLPHSIICDTDGRCGTKY